MGDLKLTENCQKLFNSSSFGNVSAKNQSRKCSENEIKSSRPNQHYAQNQNTLERLHDEYKYSVHNSFSFAEFYLQSLSIYFGPIQKY